MQWEKGRSTSILLPGKGVCKRSALDYDILIVVSSLQPPDNAPVGTGFYTVAEAARLTKIPARNINRWLGGYSSIAKGAVGEHPPLWVPQLPRARRHIELGFRDLIELRFVQAFQKAGGAVFELPLTSTRIRPMDR